MRYRQLVLSGLSLGALWSAHAHAAQAPHVLPSALQAGAALMAEGGDPSEIDAVVVTGSRLQNSGFQAPTPVTVLGQEAMQQRAPSSISDVVNELPAFRQTATNSQNQRGNGNGGQNRADLRGLGAERTLVLVNGRRHVPTNLNGTLDINMIPTPLVDRVEVVTGGASAAYGSDAVSGVVNFILKRSIDGVQGSVQYGVSEHGDNIEPAVSLAAGTSFAGGRGELLVGGDYSDNRGVGKIYTREWGRREAGLVSFGALATRGALPAQGLSENVTFATQTDGGIINSGPLRGTAFGAGGAPFAFQYGQVYSTLMIGGANTPDANPFGNWNLVAPHRRATAMVKADFDLTASTRVFAEYGYAKLHAPGRANYHQTPSLIVPITNPFIPAATRAAMVANNLTSITIGRYDTEVGGLLLLAENATQRGAFGIEGDLGRGWKWDAYYEHGVTDGEAKVFTNTHQANWLAATYVVTGANGQPVCGPVATNPNLTGANASRVAQVQPGCEPYNVFGRNSASAAAVEYIKRESNNFTRYQQDVVAANLTGEPFSTWAGPVSVAAGVERRRETGSSRASDLGAIEAFLSNNGSTYAGKVSVTEGYLEAGVPLARDTSWAIALDLNAAVRRTDYSTSGAVTTWKVGVTYEPNAMVRLRATRSRDIRAPNIPELFLTNARGTNNTFVNPINGITGQLFTVSGGNPNLRPEIADSLTAGVVLQPTWPRLRGLRASIDYYSVEINDVIASVSAIDITQRCANGIAAYCNLIVFNSTPFGISEVRTSPANLNKLETSGVDIELAYRAPLDDWGMPGSLDVRSVTTHVRKLSTTDAVSSIDRAGSGAQGGVPGWTSNLNITYALGQFSNSLQLRYTAAIRGDASLVGPEDDGYDPKLSNSINRNRFPSAVYVNWSAQYDLIAGQPGALQAFGVINNLLDKDPASTSLAAFSFGGNPYDIIGRAYKVGLRFKF